VSASIVITDREMSESVLDCGLARIPACITYRTLLGSSSRIEIGKSLELQEGNNRHGVRR
jgi:hypothetical protein